MAHSRGNRTNKVTVIEPELDADKYKQPAVRKFRGSSGVPGTGQRSRAKSGASRKG